MGKLRVGLLYGGRSVEHDVSIVSANSILGALDRERYDVSLIRVGRDGHWQLDPGSERIDPGASTGDAVLLPPAPSDRTLVPAGPAAPGAAEGLDLDVVFPIIHGRGGEDGALQGLFELAEVAYVGSGVLSSAVQMDKDVAKRLLTAAGLPVVPWITLRGPAVSGSGRDKAVEAIAKEFDFPVFVKPANSGSSVGISRAGDRAELSEALELATRYDTKVIVERGIDAREVEVAVLGNAAPEASVPGEIIPTHDFYDYEAKYHDATTKLDIPAKLGPEETMQVREMAIHAFLALEGEGMARVDFLLDRETGKPYINELNSLPGFTNGSMYPRLWEASGLSYSALLDRLIDLAIERHREHQRLETQYLREGR